MPAPPAAIYISLHVGSPGRSGTQGDVTVGLIRARGVIKAADWSAPVMSRQGDTWLYLITNTVVVPLATAAAATVTISHFGCWDAEQGGNFLDHGTIAGPFTVIAGDAVRFPVGSLTIRVPSPAVLFPEANLGGSALMRATPAGTLTKVTPAVATCDGVRMYGFFLDPPNTNSIVGGPFLLGYHFRVTTDRSIGHVGLYKTSPNLNSVGIWDFTNESQPVLLRQFVHNTSDFRSFDGTFYWYTISDMPILRANRDYVVAAAWGTQLVPSEFQPNQMYTASGVQTFNNAYNTNTLPSLSANLTSYPPVDSDTAVLKSYYTVNFVLFSAPASPAWSFYPNSLTPARTVSTPADIRVFGYHFATQVDRTLRSVGIYAVTTRDHTVGIWDFSVTPPLLLWQKQIPTSEPYIQIEAFRWYAAPELHLIANRDYVIATTWGQSEPVPAAIDPSELLLNIPQFGLLNSARRTVPPDALPSSFLTDLTPFPPAGASDSANKGYFTASMQLSDCAPQLLYSFVSAPPTITLPPEYRYQVYGFEFEREIESTVKEVGIWSASTTDHTIGIWDISASPVLIWQRQIPANEPYYYIHKSYRWYNVSNGPRLFVDRTYVVAMTWATGGLPCRTPPNNLNIIPGGKLGDSKATSEANPVTLPLLTDLSNPLYYPSERIGGDEKGYYGVNLSLL